MFKFSLLIASFSVRHNLSLNAKNDLLKILKLILPKPNLLPRTYNQLFKIANYNENKIDSIKYCSTCKFLLDKEDFCSSFQNNCKDIDLFYFTSIIPQIELIIKLQYDQILKFLNCKKSYIDLIDSHHYKKKKRTH